MDFFRIENFQDEYLEVELLADFKNSHHSHQRIYYLHDDLFLTCFHDVKNEKLFYLDVYEKESLRDCLKKQTLNKTKLTALLNKCLEIFEALSNEMVISDLRYIYATNDMSSLCFLKLPVYIDTYLAKDAFLEFCFALFEEMDFEGDDAWLSKLYLILKRKPFSFVAVHNYLDKKPEKKGWFSFLKQQNKQDDFFSTYIVKEEEYPYEGLSQDTRLLDNKTQVLFSGVNYGFLEDESKNIQFLSPLPFVIGRLQESNLRLEAKDVSKKHALIDCDELGVYIQDCHSTNGTKINEQKIDKHYLNDLDKIEISSCHFIYHKGE